MDILAGPARVRRSRALPMAGWLLACLTLVAPAAGQQPPPDASWTADALVDVDKPSRAWA